MVLGDASRHRDVCMDFELCFKVHNLVSIHHKSIKLGQMTTLNVIFYVVVSVYRLGKIETRLSSLGNGPGEVGEYRTTSPIDID